MNGASELLDIIANEAHASICSTRQVSTSGKTSKGDGKVAVLPTVTYNLRLVRYPDGRLEWED